ncbi:MAG: hypothetical protein GX804_08450 [Lentisphaerae bacterium]|nr:hypothetical protein [Lentisphaerota bacterium]
MEKIQTLSLDKPCKGRAGFSANRRNVAQFSHAPQTVARTFLSVPACWVA